MAEFKKAKEAILLYLEEHLPEHLSYHSLDHTLDVYQVCMELAGHSKVSEEDRELLGTAALLHDIGFVRTYKGHEEASAQIARELLPQFGYGPEQIQRIIELIMVTRVPQSPTDLLGRLLCDADLDYLGRSDFFVTGNRLFSEFKSLGIVQDEREWNHLQVQFLSVHHYHTDYSRAHREPLKQQHLEQVKEIVAGYVD
ncbi:HD domain-containing protein [Cryomorphaceae bacterium]|nr:HD domain-containing protein [Cryomorphaceae bacterium]